MLDRRRQFFSTGPRGSACAVALGSMRLSSWRRRAGRRTTPARITVMESPVTARPSPVTTAHRAGPLGPTYPVPSAAPEALRHSAAFSHTCVVCGAQFTAVRPTARSCSGRCRVALSRNRRVAEFVQRLAAAEAALCAAQTAVKGAGAVLRDLHLLAEQSGGKLAP
jgi:predicted nucleic acid-binding Zn ribbon protein